MASHAQKPRVTLGGTLLSGVGAVVWKFQTGTQPYTSVFSVHISAWKGKLENAMGRPLPMRVIDSRGVATDIADLFILRQVPSDSPHRASFLVADRRWKWAYKLVARDYNIPKKTGDRTALKEDVPVELLRSRDEYDYRPYSLDIGGVRWTPETAVEDVLSILEDPAEGGAHIIESLPIENASGDGQFTLQNIILRDQGDVALARLLSYIPGAEVYVDAKGMVRVFDGSDLQAAEDYFNELPPKTWDGDRVAFVDRTQIRPSEVRIHYQREVELVLEFDDDYSVGSQRTDPASTSPFIDNVIPTVDPKTDITEFDPDIGPSGERVLKPDLPPGTWVNVKDWLTAMDAIKPDGSLPWTFETVQRHWFKGDLDGVLGGRGLDLDEDGTVSMRIQALKQHFRQTFRINRRYVERVRDIQAIRVALLDPVTGARAQAAVWGQACVVPTTKGKLMASRSDDDNSGVFRNVDYLAPSKVAGTRLISTAPGPTRVNIMDRDLGIFRLEWIVSPYGTVESFVPCHLVGENDTSTPKVVTRDLSLQTTQPIGAGCKIEGGTNGIFLRDTLEYKVMITIVPAAPNNLRQFHVETVKASDIADVFRTEFRIQGGEGPPLDVFIPPGEVTARYAWENDTKAAATIVELLGLDDDDPRTAGVPSQTGQDLDGFVLINAQVELPGHSKAVAAEMLAPFADSLQGRVTTVVPRNGLKLTGNMSGATLQVAAAPSAKVNAIHEFSGQQKPISRLALMPEAVRHIVLGIVPYGKGDK